MIKSAVILAGGKSTRFGYPKGLLVVDGQPLIENLIREIKSAGIDLVFISTDKPELYESFGCRIIGDRFSGCGPLAGIHAALEEIPDDAFLVLSCDLARITSTEIRALIENSQFEIAPVVYAVTQFRQHPLCAVIKKDILNALANALLKGNYGVLDFFDSVDFRTVFFENEKPFLNMNTPDDLKNESDDSIDYELFEEKSVIRYVSGSGPKEVDDPVVRDALIRVWLNDDEIAGIQALPKEVEELALGFLYSECIINEPSKVESVDFNEKLLAVTVKTSEKISHSGDGLVRNVAPGCGQVVFSVAPSFIECFDPIETDFSLNAEMVPVLMRHLMRSSHLFKATGGVHTAGLSDCESVLHISDDIGRHNCVDKIIGHILMNPNVSPDRRMILTSGRVSTDIVLKAVRGHFPFVVSHSAPSVGSIQLAEKYGITLVGFARGSRFNIYTHKERVAL